MSEIKLSLSLEQFASLQKLFYLGKWKLEKGYRAIGSISTMYLRILIRSIL